MATSPRNKSRKNASKNGKEVVDEVPADENASGDEESYEVEAILDAKWAYNKRGKWSYYVRWKGYGSEDDLWIDEEDAGGAEDLINEYHKTANLPRDGKGKKGPVKKPRASAAKSVPDKKRKATSGDEMEVDSPDAEEPPSKKQSRRGRPSKSKASAEPEPEPEAEAEAEAEEDDEELEFASMEEFMKRARWDTILQEINTVEQTDGDLVALITLADGRKGKCSTTVLAERCPQELIKFYETHLKWRPTDED